MRTFTANLTTWNGANKKRDENKFHFPTPVSCFFGLLSSPFFAALISIVTRGDGGAKLRPDNARRDTANDFHTDRYIYTTALFHSVHFSLLLELEARCSKKKAL